MNKKEFINALKSKLDILEDQEIDDIINEYKGYIEEKVNKGKTEEEAVEELGNIEEIVDDLLSAYKIKKKKEINTTNILEQIINRISNFVDIIVGNIKGRSLTDIFKFGFSLAIIFLLILIAKIPFILIENAGRNILYSFDWAITDMLGQAWILIIEFCYLFIAIIAFVNIVEKEFWISEKERVKVIKNQNKVANESKVEKKIEKEIVVVPKNDGIIDKFFNLVGKICLFFIKFVIFWILIAIAFYIVCMSFGFSTLIILFIDGFKYFGVVLICFALLFLGIVFAELFFKLLVNKQNNWKRIFISVVSGLLLLGVGTGLTVMDFSNTEFKEIESNVKTNEEEYTMKDDLVIVNFYEAEYEIDNKIDNIKITYEYNDNFIRFDHFSILDENYLTLGVYSSKFDKETFDYFIEGLKNKILYYYDGSNASKITIKVNEQNYKTLKDNYLKYDSWYYGNNCEWECDTELIDE